MDEIGYFSVIRHEILEIIPQGDHRILDIGCGTGATLKRLKDCGKAMETCGIEMNRDASIIAKQQADMILTGDAGTIDIPFEKNYFDYILFCDILEHCYNPDQILEKYASYLKDEGLVIASIPNIKYYKILCKLIFLDRFEYQNEGILDKSHIRFFTKREIVNLFSRSGYEILSIMPKIGEKVLVKDTLLHSSLKKIPGSSFFTFQYCIICRKRNCSNPIHSC